MSAFWLTFKPFGPTVPNGWPIESLRELVRQFEDNPASTTEWWRMGAYRQACIGDRVYLFKQGTDPRGIFGVGTILDGPECRSIPSDRHERYRVLVGFEKLIDPTRGFLLRLNEISDILPKKNIVTQLSGVRIDDAVAACLEERLKPR